MQDTNGDKVVLPPVIRPKLKPTSKSPVPAFTPCLLAGSKKISIVTKKKTIVPEKEVITFRDKHKPVDLVSEDKFVVDTPGQFPTGYGRESYSSCFRGSNLYNDAATGIIWFENQLSLGSSETV